VESIKDWRQALKSGKKQIWIATIGLLAGLSFTGCGSSSESVPQGGYLAAVQSMESTPIVDYIVPVQKPNILVDLMGYLAEGEKRAAIRAKELPERFYLVDADSRKVVYEGAVYQASNQTEKDVLLGYAEFDDWTTEGNYYLECDRLGRSYTFSIEEGMYGRLFDELILEVQEKCANRTVEISEVTDLLTAYEWYPELFADANDNQIPDALEVLAEWTQNLETDEGEEAVPQAAALVKFGYLYQKFDKKYATTCLQKGSAIYKQSQTTIHKDAESFYALTELYRATGLYTYRTQVEDYESYFENNSSFLEEKEYLYGAMTYMVTRQNVNVDICNVFMKQIKDRGEEVSGRYQEMIHPIAARNNGTDEILKRARELLFANYVLPSYQYNNILMDCMHYFGGLNQESVCFYENEEHTGCLLVLAQLASMENSSQ